MRTLVFALAIVSAAGSGIASEENAFDRMESFVCARSAFTGDLHLSWVDQNRKSEVVENFESGDSVLVVITPPKDLPRPIASTTQPEIALDPSDTSRLAIHLGSAEFPVKRIAMISMHHQNGGYRPLNSTELRTASRLVGENLVRCFEYR